jgi:hypothetical protein
LSFFWCRIKYIKFYLYQNVLTEIGKTIARGVDCMFDVTPLSPVVRPIVLAASEIVYKQTEPWLIGLLIHGSAYKGGSIPGCSDIDLQVYLERTAFDIYGALRLDVSVAIQRKLSTIDAGPFQYIQTYAFPPAPLPLARREHLVGPIPGTYHLLYGTLPVSEATEAEIVFSCHNTMEHIPTAIFDASHNLLSHGGGKLQRAARFICTDVWPVYFSVLSLRDGNPFAIWKLPKEEAIALTEPYESLGKEIRAFYTLVQHYFGQEHTTEDALAVIMQGVRFLRVAERWYRRSARER